VARRSSPNLNGVYAKLARGQKHLNDLEYALETFLKERPYRAVVEDGPNPGDYILRGKIVKRPPVYKFGVMIGDCVHNLRSALDQLVWELGGKTSSAPRHIAFPIFWRKAGAAGFDENASRMLDGLSRPMQDAIRAIQPYRRGRRNEPLWILHRLWIEDKHKTVEIVQSVADGMIIEENVTDSRLIPGPFKDGDVIATYRSSRPQTETDRDASVLFTEAFDVKGPGRGKPLITTLQSAEIEAVQITLKLVAIAEQA